jgi:hypothetical protein
MHEVSGVSGVFDYAGLNRNSRHRPRSYCLPCITKTSASGLHLFEAEYPPRLYLCLRFAGSLAVAAQDSRPSGSLVLTRKASSSSASCRFSPAHCKVDFQHSAFSETINAPHQLPIQTWPADDRRGIECVLLSTAQREPPAVGGQK